MALPIAPHSHGYDGLVPQISSLPRSLDGAWNRDLWVKRDRLFLSRDLYNNYYCDSQRGQRAAAKDGQGGGKDNS